MKLLIISLLVLIFNRGVTTDTSPTTPSTGATSPGTPSTDKPPTGESRSFPIRIPYNNSQDYKNIPKNWGSCFLYMEGITIVAIDHGISKTGGQHAIFAHITGTEDKNKWIFSRDDSLNCNVIQGPKVDGKDTILNGSFVEYEL